MEGISNEKKSMKGELKERFVRRSGWFVPTLHEKYIKQKMKDSEGPPRGIGRGNNRGGRNKAP
jgi:hypothetical protein